MDHLLIVMSTGLVRAVVVNVLVSTANAVYFSGLAMFDWAAGTAMVTTAAKRGRKNCSHLRPPTAEVQCKSFANAC